MAKGGPPGPDGLAVVDKAAGWTSHDVVAKARGLLGTRKVGHSGTLDPDATGVLLLGVGKVTRLLRYLGLPPKTYTGVIVLGTATSTLDASGRGHRHLGHGRRRRSTDVRAAAAALTGDILQVPPMVSADPGRRPAPARAGPRGHRGRARGRARSPSTASTVGEPPSRAASRSRSPARRAPTSARSPPTSARALGGGAHLRDLRRTAIGSFTVDQARAVEALDARGACCRRPRRCATSRRWRWTTDVAADVGSRQGPRRRRAWASTGDGPVAGGRARRRRSSPCTRRHRGATAKPSVVLAAPSPAVTSARWRCCTTSGPAPGPTPGRVVTIGAYDGVHLGHQAVIAEVRRAGRRGRHGERRRHLRPPPGLGGAPGVGAPPAHRPRAEARAARRHRARPLPRDLVRRGPVEGARRGVRPRGARRRASAPRS